MKKTGKPSAVNRYCGGNQLNLLFDLINTYSVDQKSLCWVPWYFVFLRIVSNSKTRSGNKPRKCIPKNITSCRNFQFSNDIGMIFVINWWRRNLNISPFKSILHHARLFTRSARYNLSYVCFRKPTIQNCTIVTLMCVLICHLVWCHQAVLAWARSIISDI